MIMLDSDSRQAIGTLRQLLVGGEAFPVPLARELLDLGGPEVINMYGPTETTIWSAVHVLQDASDQIPIGRPIANTQIYLLNNQMALVPQGAVGELYIGGDGLAREYLGRPELTAERFIASPFRDGGARIYKTGDLARYSPSGVLEFLGRVDFQVKLRGHRIELGEIETILGQHSEVREAVVVVRDLGDNDQRLVAYLVMSETAEVSDSDLRALCQAALPDYMVPSHFVRLRHLPRTPNGKTDRQALPAPQIELPSASHASAEGDLESTIAAIWCTVLNAPSVSVTTNFFEAGGHSLLAVQIHRRLVEEVDADLRLTDIFRFPTIRSLSHYLASMGAVGNESVAQGSRFGHRRRQMIGTRNRLPVD
jgi:acyl-coenzyme A synthetase/AMP-(fatty) acid ligase